jgi:hypothetical protein
MLLSTESARPKESKPRVRAAGWHGFRSVVAPKRGSLTVSLTVKRDALLTHLHTGACMEYSMRLLINVAAAGSGWTWMQY